MIMVYTDGKMETDESKNESDRVQHRNAILQYVHIGNI